MSGNVLRILQQPVSMGNNMVIIGKNIFMWRKKRGFGLNELARRAGVDKGNLSKMEGGTLNPSMKTLAKLAHALDISSNELLREDSNVEYVLHEGTRRIRVLDWKEVSRMTDTKAELLSPIGEMHDFLLVSPTASSKTFALRIRDDSMEPTFKRGDIVVIDPDVKPLPGNYVVATDDAGDATLKMFKDLGLDGEGRKIFELIPLNSLYAARRSDRESLVITGTAVEHRSQLISQKLAP